MIFKYKEIVRPDGSKVKAPVIMVTFIGPKETFDLICMVDSGADISILSKDMAESLGLDLTGKEGIAYGVGGKVRTVDSHVNIAVGNEHDRFTMSLPVKVILDPYEMYPLLGRRGFFESFDIMVREKNKRIDLTFVPR